MKRSNEVTDASLSISSSLQFLYAARAETQLLVYTGVIAEHLPQSPKLISAPAGLDPCAQLDSICEVFAGDNATWHGNMGTGPP